MTRVFRLAGRVAYHWYLRTILLGSLALGCAAFGIHQLLDVGSPYGVQSGIILLTVAATLAVFAGSALLFIPPTVVLSDDGAVTFRAIGGHLSMTADEITAIRWIRPASWRDQPLSKLEAFRVESVSKRFRVEAVPPTFCEFARAVSRLNPGIELDIPCLEPRPEAAPDPHPHPSAGHEDVPIGK